MEFSKLKPSERLDEVLRYLVTLPYPNMADLGQIYTVLKEKGYKFRSKDIWLIIRQLEKDGYVGMQSWTENNKAGVKITRDCYYSTFDGESLLELENGYTGRIKILKQSKEREIRRTIFLGLASGIVGTVVGVLLTVLLTKPPEEPRPRQRDVLIGPPIHDTVDIKNQQSSSDTLAKKACL